MRGKVLKNEAVARFEPSANGIGTVYCVAITQRLINDGVYLGPVNTNQVISDQCKMNKEQQYDIQIIKMGEYPSETF